MGTILGSPYFGKLPYSDITTLKEHQMKRKWKIMWKLGLGCGLCVSGLPITIVTDTFIGHTCLCWGGTSQSVGNWGHG